MKILYRILICLTSIFLNIIFLISITNVIGLILTLNVEFIVKSSISFWMIISNMFIHYKLYSLLRNALKKVLDIDGNK